MIATPFCFSIASGHARSALSGRPVDRHGQPIPWYTLPAIDLLRGQDFAGKRVLEFGGGQSTRWWAARGATVLTIEEDAAWAGELLKSGLDVRHVPIERETRSIAEIRRIIGDRTFDVIVVDGHLREECARLATAHLVPGGALILDNSEGYNLQPAMTELGWSQVHLWGYAPGVWRQHCTTIAYRGACFLFDPSAARAALPEARYRLRTA